MDQVTLPDVFKIPKLTTVLDSGAHSLYVQWFAGVPGKEGAKGAWSRENAQYTFMQSPEFKRYLDSYIEFLSENQKHFGWCVTLDIIGNGEKSWELLKYMESFGLNVLPVYHFGEDVKWVKKMVDEYDYIGVGGIGQDISKKRFTPFADRAFEVICGNTRSKGFGKPKVKVHGFAMGSVEIMLRYPFYSCDQTTWTYMARVGTIQLPHVHLDTQGGIKDFDYLQSANLFAVTENRKQTKHHKVHLEYKGDLTRHVVEQIANMHGYTIDDLVTRYLCRDVVNYHWYYNMAKSVKEVYDEKFDWKQGANLFFAGIPCSCTNYFHDLIKLLYSFNTPDINILTTYFYPQFMYNMLTIKKATEKEENLTEFLTTHPNTLVVPEREKQASKIKKQHKKKKEANVVPVVQQSKLFDFNRTPRQRINMRALRTKI